MKKLAVLFVLILVCLFSVTANADQTVTYTLDDLNMSLDVPSDWMTLTRDVDDSDPNLAELGLSADDIKVHFEDNYIYLNSIYNAEDSVVEIVVTMLDYTGSNAVYNFKNLSSSELSEAAQELEGELEEQTGAVYQFVDIYSNDQATFMCFDLQQELEGMIIYGHQCYTIANGKAINITMHSYQNPITPEMNAMLYAMVDSAEFESEQEKPAAKSVNIYQAVRTGLIMGALFGGVLLVFSLFSKKARAKRKAKNKPDDFTDMSS